MKAPDWSWKSSECEELEWKRDEHEGFRPDIEKARMGLRLKGLDRDLSKIDEVESCLDRNRNGGDCNG